MEIPAPRVEMGYTKCISCSTEEKYGFVDVVYHKTGNTIEVLDAESARKMNKLAKRSGFGSLKSMRGGSGGSSNSGVKIAKVVTHQEWEKHGEEIMKTYEERGIQEAKDLVQRKLSGCLITPLQANRTLEILDLLHNPSLAEEKITVAWKPELPFEPRPEIDPEIERAMRDWKK